MLGRMLRGFSRTVLDTHTPNLDMGEDVGRMSSFQILSLIHPQRHSSIRNVQCSFLSVP